MTRLLLCLGGLLALMGYSQAQSPAPTYPLPQTATLVLQSDPTKAIGITNYLAYLVPISSGNAAKFNIVQGLADPKYVSFESVQFPGYFLRHQYCQVKLHPYADNDGLYASDATFVPVPYAKAQGSYMFRAYAPSWLWLAVTRGNAIFVAPNQRYEDLVFTPTP
jgi:hypothetical protein